MELLVASKIAGKYMTYVKNTGDPLGGKTDILRTPKPPNAYANFVKDHYKDFRTPGSSHKDVMQALSLQFSQTKISK